MPRSLRRGILLADVLWSILAIFLAYQFRNGFQGWPGIYQCLHEYFVFLSVGLLVWTFLFWKMELHGFKGGWSLPAILSQVVVGVSFLMAILLSLAFMARLYYSRLVLTFFPVLLVVGFIAIRILVRLALQSRYRIGAARRVVILGHGRIAHELATKIARHPETMWQVIGFLYPNGTERFPGSPDREQEMDSLTTLAVPQRLRQQLVDELIIVTPETAQREIQKLVEECQQSGIRVSVVPQWYQLYVSKAHVLEIDGLPLLTFEEDAPSHRALVLKRILDLVGATLLQLLAAPLQLIISTALYLEKGRVLRHELRCGRDGKPFLMHRFDIDRDDPTLVGYRHLLAQLSLSELPQLWNVLRGEMSLVGPRPESFDRVKHYSEWQKQRLRVSPGLTGLAQVHGLREQHSSEEKARFDLEYIYHWSLFSDVSLLLQTAWTLVIRLRHPKPSAPLTPFSTAPTRVSVPEVVHADSTQSSAD
jgi:lipopolysaccharide/colanic/teichoic acid biosynthesis glycosyltransferase